jgi:hypothetical protein
MPLSKRSTITIQFTMTQELSWTGTVKDLMAYTGLTFEDIRQAFAENPDLGPLVARLYTVADPSHSIIEDEAFEINNVTMTDRE